MPAIAYLCRKKVQETKTFIAKTLFGFEDILADELTQMNATNIQHLYRAVSFEGTYETMYKANYRCRTALHILMPVLEFKFRDKEQFYKSVNEYDWTAHFTWDKTISLDTVMSNSIFSNSHYVSLFAKDAIVDHFRDKLNRRPSVSLDNPDIKIHVHIREHHCSISLDSSGESLHKRGYRLQQALAPMSEVLASGLLMLAGWKGESDLYDPMCGSGTLLSEAAMIAGNIPAGYYRRKFGFMQWNDFNEELWNEVKAKADEEIGESDCRISGSDLSELAVKAAQKNIRNAKLHKDVTIEKADFRDIDFPSTKGFIITNPPYGERINPDDIIQLYREFGNMLKTKCPGYTAWIISGHTEALKFVGLKPSKKITVYNGPLECKFVKFELFEGSLKAKKQQDAGQND
jgi:putative N6-adenine-specific DNA methylase